MINWQNILVALILVVTGIYIGRRVWSRVQSLVRTDEASCGGGGCAGCGSPAAARTVPRSQIASKTKVSTFRLIN
jgi:hypothetical protein